MSKILKNKDLEMFFLDKIKNSKEHIKQLFQSYEPYKLFDNWHLLIRSIDEFINIPLMIEEEDRKKLLSLKLDLSNFQQTGNESRNILKKYFNDKAVNNYANILLQVSSLNAALSNQYFYKSNYLNFEDIKNCVLYFQSRRKYITEVLYYIPYLAKGNDEIPYYNLMNTFVIHLEFNLFQTYSDSLSLFLSNILPDYEVSIENNYVKPNIFFKNLESFFLNPERTSIIDEMNYSKEIKVLRESNYDQNKIYSFQELISNIKSIEDTFNNYGITSSPSFIAIVNVIKQLEKFITADYYIYVPKKDFLNILYQSVQNLKTSKDKLYEILVYSFNGISSVKPLIKPFIYLDKLDYYVSNIFFLLNHIYNYKNNILFYNKKYQINSGFIFERKIIDILKTYNFEYKDIKRINRKEFDIVATQKDTIYNFQCKNSLFDISDLDETNYIKYGEINNLRVDYFKKAYTKEVNREDLLLKRLNLSKIKHFVLSRFPVVTKDEHIINYNNFEKWLEDNSY